MDLPNDLKLELVQVVFRHGARVYSKRETVVLNPEDVDQPLVEQFGFEQLTKLGKNQAHNLGRALRERYDEFLGSGYRPQEVYAYSSDTDRTKTSLQLVLAGLFPPSEEQRWHPGLAWTPVPFHSAPIELDILLRANDKPKYNQVFKTVCAYTPEIQMSFLEMQAFSKILHNNGVAVSRYGCVHGICAMHNIFTIQKTEKRKLPNWYSDDLLVKLRHYFECLLDFMSYTNELKKLFTGALLKQLIENLNLNNEVQNPRKIYLYSGHELNVAAVVRSVGIMDFGYPDFSSAVVMEKLRDLKGRLYVRFLGYTGRDDKFVPLKMRNCEQICRIDDFLNRIKDVIPSDEEIQEMYKDMDVDIRRAFVTDFVHKN